MAEGNFIEFSKFLFVALTDPPKFLFVTEKEFIEPTVKEELEVAP